jgi:hypothetical protein
MKDSKTDLIKDHNSTCSSGEGLLIQYRKRHAYVNLAFIAAFKAHTHQLDILRHFTDIGYIM